MIRVAAIKQQIEAQVVRRSDDGRLPAEHLAAISDASAQLAATQMRLLNDELVAGARSARASRSLRVSELDDETQTRSSARSTTGSFRC